MRSGLAAIITVAAVAACGGAHPEDSVSALPAASGAILLMGVELPEAGTVFGGHFGGRAFDVQQASYMLSEAVRARWEREARTRGEALLRGAGFRVYAMAGASSDAQSLRGVQYGLSGKVTGLAVRSTGSAPFRVDAQLEIAWELLDLGTGTAVYGRTLQQSVREAGLLDTVVAHAIDGLLGRLIADSSFRYALAVTRADPDAGAPMRFARPLPDPDQVISLSRADLNPSTDSSLLGRVSAGLVTLRHAEGTLGTAIMITRDGLALSSARSLRGVRRLRARMAAGMERPVRIVRMNRGLDVALIQVACVECETVDWDAPEGVDAYTSIVAIGAPRDDTHGISFTFGRVGGRWGIASGLTLEITHDAPIGGGDPVARINSGRVFGLVSSRSGINSVLLLSEVLAALKVRMEPATPRT